ncbi:AAA family ATPase [Streptomyces scabiei]|uniref:AAA family ATPase n=1 Tax=Streptomyces scabiei TaxID=1930 RepID=UPI00068E99A3|nr:AAA family ATPase [Streptomyces scabiei]MDX2829445.1 AAA family ATPase [Streptomyces scabiei]MDX3674999.1 AAA family ATPase [Streptomyces scabiei]
MSAFERVMYALRDHGENVIHRGGTARTRGICHDGDAPDTVSIGIGADKKVLIHCHKECPLEDFLTPLGMAPPDLFDEQKPKNGSLGMVVKTWTYKRVDKSVVQYVHKYLPKDFRPELPNGEMKSPPKEERVLLYLPEVHAQVQDGGVITLCEGETDTDNAIKAGAVATTMPGGTGMGWQERYTDMLRGASEVRIISDRDPEGQGLKHARKVAASLGRAGIPWRIYLPAAGKDLSDHLSTGATLNDLIEVRDDDEPAEEAPPEQDADERLDPENTSSEEYFEASIERLLGQLLDTDGLDGIPPLEPLVGDLLAMNTIARAVGPSGTFKSFVLLDIAGHVGTGMKWHGHYVRQGLVVYLVAEGEQGIRKRVRAWEQHHGMRMDNVRFLPRPVQAMGPEWDVLIAALGRIRPVLIIVDTQARVTLGVEENSNTEMGRIVDRFDQLRIDTGACVVAVHHTGHVGEHGRGASAVKGALQSELHVSRKGDKIPNTILTIKSGKQKDEDQDGDLQFGLKKISLDGEHKPDGRPVTSLVLVSLDVPQDGPHPAPEGSVEWIVQQLDKANVPDDYGRRKLRTECQRLGFQARDTKLQEVANIRRERSTERFPDRFPGLEDEAVPGSGTITEGTAGQTGSAPVGNRKEPRAHAPVVPSPPLGREPVVHEGPKCSVCHTLLDAEWAALGHDRHVMC